ncbi:MAG: manganese efflux pump [Lachnospiraceae bacterium]|jgi:putative Mn2+ efflux pump MntP|nr:manganese efflux pump [Lachnospiraceae bacterium]
MTMFELFVIAVGLSMDAFAVSVCKGLSLQKMTWKHACLAGLYFGGFQAAMPLLGYLLGVRFQESIVSIDHWAAFILLGIIGINMVREAIGGDEEEGDPSFDVKSMLMLAVATSIDALAVGVTFAFLKVKILPAVVFIGLTTFVLSMTGVKVGNVFGSRYKSKSELAGGLILIGMGIKILLEHTILA